MMIPRRLDKFIADCTGLPRREIHRRLKHDVVRIERPAPWESPQAWPETLIYADDRVFFEQTLLQPRAPSSYFMHHKPMGVVSTTSSPSGAPCLGPTLDALPEGTFPVGRLDRDTTGLMLMIDDGDLAHLLLHPKFHIEKEYILRIPGPLHSDDPRIARALEGVELNDGPARALSARVVSSDEDHSLLGLIVDEGRKHLVRRMARALDLRLQHLHRARMGELQLGELALGETRALGEGEVAALWRAVGGQERVMRRRLGALFRIADDRRTEARPELRLEHYLEHAGQKLADSLNISTP
ncbi:rRNA pseudouridine synthase [Bradymonadaceae bacterium TMQ3]|nr:rRNA pseudouridine synthase [Bradymonadaceae bacterium TMQ3]TXC67689.1 rRNA pseudouridine synthase [Bradymonadales bacterium TMQ1]